MFRSQHLLTHRQYRAVLLLRLAMALLLLQHRRQIIAACQCLGVLRPQQPLPQFQHHPVLFFRLRMPALVIQCGRKIVPAVQSVRMLRS